MHFQAVVMNVADLDRSIEFYGEVFGFTELSRKDQLAAMYAPGAEYPEVIILRALGTTGRAVGARHSGIRALVLEVGSVAEVERIGDALDQRGFLETRREGPTWTAAFGRDPDRTALVAGCSLTSDGISLEAWAALDEALYGLGE